MWERPAHPLSGRSLTLGHHRDSLPDEAHADDHDRRLQICQRKATNHIPEPKLHGPVIGV
ncbi:unnamed protein product [Staurois parvus]|uniref:Uncharacterized protein n=1 Tax=Staurois parvus TaxID=386267 RepID=A0ABN9EXZ8_9NEOB|nr:unnamed protein product [Staurois parvus]